MNIKEIIHQLEGESDSRELHSENGKIMKIKVLNYFIINQFKPNQKNILDVQIIDEAEKEGSLINKKFFNSEKNVSFTVRSVGHINPAVENYYLLTVEIEEGFDLKEFKGFIFANSL